MKQAATGGSPGSCIGHYSSIEEACKQCVKSDECRESTRERKRARRKDRNAKSGKAEKKVGVPSKVTAVYTSAIAKMSDSFTFAKVTSSTDGMKTYFHKKVGGKPRKVAVLEFSMDEDGKYGVVLRNVKGWPNEFNFPVKSAKTIERKRKLIATKLRK